MEPNEVLKQYIEFCNSRSAFLKYSLANNAILEWFGRTIRGRHKIYNFCRYELCQQYEHHFYNAKCCDPIESRPTHLETKEIVNDDKLNETNISIKHNIIHITPNKFGIVSPKLPNLNRGLKFIADSDEEEELNELGLSPIRDATTPPPPQSLQSIIDEPPIKKFKHSNYNNKLVDDLVQTSSNNVIEINKNLNGIPCSSYNNLIPTNSTNNDEYKQKYSPLMYLEVSGILRMLNYTKHRGVHTPTTSNVYIETNFPDIRRSSNEFTSNAYWDRDTKLKISYRIRKLDSQIEFTLIIYEHMTRNSTTKRNLLAEFDDTIKDNNNELISNKKTLAQVKKELNISAETPRKKPLKRLLRLF